MSGSDKRIAEDLASAAEYQVMGEIAAHTGLLVNQEPRDGDDYDIIVNNVDMSRSCKVEVIHSHDRFSGTIKSTDYDFLALVYAPCEIVDGTIKPCTEKQAAEAKGIYIFPRSVVKTAVDEATGTKFDPKNIQADGVIDENKYKEYRGAFHLISALVPNTPPDFI